MGDRLSMSSRVLMSACASVFVTISCVGAGQQGGASPDSGRTSPDTAAPTPSRNASTWTPPRTPDGQPDLQGVWVNLSAAPLERPKALEGKSSLTDEEVQELKRRADRLFQDGNADLPVGDSLFLAALSNPENFRNPNGANRSAANMIPRYFDNRTSLVVSPADGRIPALTPDAQQRRAAAQAKDRAPAGPEDVNNFTRCITQGVPRIGDPQYGYYQILQSTGYVVLLMEAIHDTRIIPLDGRQHLPDRLRQWSGDSRGRWEGDTLIVDTTNFDSKARPLGSGEGLHLVERFTRVGPDRIDYEATLDDAQTWTSPWTAQIPLSRTDDRIFEFGCHEGNQDAMLSVLGTARAAEKAKPR